MEIRNVMPAECRRQWPLHGDPGFSTLALGNYGIRSYAAEAKPMNVLASQAGPSIAPWVKATGGVLSTAPEN